MIDLTSFVTTECPPGAVGLPTLPERWISRHRLALRIISTTKLLTLVSGPVGAGKTVLLSLWARDDANADVVFVTLREADNDLGEFWVDIQSALVAATPPVARIYEVDHRHAADARTGACVRSTSARPLTLVLDNLHVIRNRAVVQSLTALTRGLPPGVRVILAGREMSRFPSSHLVRSGAAELISAEDLRFTAEEASALLALAAGRVPHHHDVHAVVERTGGLARDVAAEAARFKDQVSFSGDWTEFVPAEHVARSHQEVSPPDDRSLVRSLASALHERRGGSGLTSSNHRRDASEVIEPLTKKEAELLAYLPSHLSLREIAALMFISINTVKTHTSAVHRKLAVGTRSEAVSAARRQGLLPPAAEPDYFDWNHAFVLARRESSRHQSRAAFDDAMATPARWASAGPSHMAASGLNGIR